MKDKILQLRSEGKTYRQIKQELNCSTSTVSYHCGVGQKEKNRERLRRYRSHDYAPIIKSVPICMGGCGNRVKRQWRYCSDKCRIKFKHNRGLALLDENKIYNTTRIRRILSREFGENCFECGQGNLWNGKNLTLQVDHISGNSDDSTLKNLRLLCPNCHSQTKTFCGGKKNRKETKRNKYLRKYKGYKD